MLPEVDPQNYLVGGALSDTKQLLQNHFLPVQIQKTSSKRVNPQRNFNHPGVDRLGSMTLAHAIPAVSDGFGLTQYVPCEYYKRLTFVGRCGYGSALCLHAQLSSDNARHTRKLACTFACLFVSTKQWLSQ